MSEAQGDRSMQISAAVEVQLWFDDLNPDDIWQVKAELRDRLLGAVHEAFKDDADLNHIRLLDAITVNGWS